MKIPESFVAALLLSVAGISNTDASASGGPMGNPAGTGYYYQEPQQQWQGQQQQNQYGYENPQQEQQQQDQIGADKQDGGVPPLPPGWSEHIDPASGQPYYYNANDGTTTWDRPEVEEANVEEVDVREEVAVEEETKEPELVAEKGIEPSADGSETQYFSEDSRRQAMSGSQLEQDHGSQEKPSWGKNQTDSAQRRENQQQGWGMPQQQDQRPAWGVKPDDMRKEEQEDRSGMAEKPSMYQDQQYREPDQPNLTQDRPDLMQKPMQQPEPEELKEPEQQFQSYQQPPRDWQRQLAQQEESRPAAFSQTPDPTKSFPSASGALDEFSQAQAQSQRHPRQNQPGHQRPPFEQQLPTEQQQRGMPHQQSGGPQAGLQTPPQQQQRPIQPGQPQRQLPPWQQQQQQQQGQQFPRPQGPPQQGVPPQGQYGQYNPQGYGQQQQYGQYGAPPPGYGHQPQPESQVVAQSETVSAVKDALGNAWKGVLGFGSRTKEVAGQAKETVAAKAAAAGQTIGSASQGIIGQAKSSLNAVFEGGGDDDTNKQGYSLSGHYGAPPAPGQYGQQPPQQQGGYPPQQYGGAGPQGYQPQQRNIPPYPHQGAPHQGQQPPLQSQWGSSQQGQPPPQQGYPPRQQGPYGPGPGQQGFPPNQQGGPPQRQQGGPPPRGHEQRKGPDEDPSRHPGWGSGY